MNFARELSDLLSGPPKVSQTKLASRSGMLKSKISRIINGQTPADKATLDAILRAFPEASTRSILVAAYIKDAVSDFALSYVRVQARGRNEPLDLRHLSSKGRRALKALLQSESHCSAFERITVSLAAALGIEP